MPGIALIASADEAIRKRLTQAVTQMQWQCEILRHGRELLNELRAGLIPDLIFLDEDLPRVDGLSILKSFAAIPGDERCPIVMILAGEDRAGERELLQLGADECLPASFRLPDAITTFRRLTWEGGETEIRAFLNQEPQPDTELGESFSTTLFKDLAVYPLPAEDALYLVLNRGDKPKALAAASLRELKGKVSLYRHTPTGWRKVWPRSGRPLVGQLVGA